MKISSIAALKRALPVGALIECIDHKNPELIGLTRQVTKVQKNGVYAGAYEKPDHKISTCNGRKGFFMPFDKASHYEFGEESIKWFMLPKGSEGNSLIMEFQVLTA